MKYIPVRTTDAEAALTDAVENAQKVTSAAINALLGERTWGWGWTPFFGASVLVDPYTTSRISADSLAPACRDREASIKQLAHQASYGGDRTHTTEHFHERTIASAVEIVAAEALQKPVTEARERLQAQVEAAAADIYRHRSTDVQVVNLCAAIEVLRSTRKVEVAINDLISRLPELVKDKNIVLDALRNHSHKLLDKAFKHGKFVLDEPEQRQS